LRCLLDERKEPVEIGTDYGVIKEIFVANDWTSTTQAFSRHQNDKCPTEKDVPGFFVLICRVCTFAGSRSRKALIDVLSALHGNRQFLDVLPRWLTVQVPSIPDKCMGRVLDTLMSMDDNVFAAALTSRCIGGVPLDRNIRLDNFSSTDKPDVDQLKKMALHIPAMMITLWKGDFYFPGMRFNDIENVDKILFPALVDGFVAHPADFFVVPWAWSIVLEAASDRQGELRKVLLDNAEDCEPMCYFAASTEFRCVQLDLPREASLLPHMLVALLSMTQHRATHRPGVEIRDRICAVAQDICRDEAVLNEIVKQTTFPPSVRCAALLHLMLVTKSLAALGLGSPVLQAGYVSSTVPWLLEAVVTELSLFDSENDEMAQSVTALLFSAAKHDYAGNQELQRLLQFWRETSRSPLQTNGNAEVGLLV
jgi:hypothetical protein